MAVTGKPSISDPRAFDLRAFQGAVSNIRQRIEALERESAALLGAIGILRSSSSSSGGTSTTIVGTGTVSSVAATVPNFLEISGSPITAVGTLAFSLATQQASKVFAGPVSGADAVPTFRQLEWEYDIPLISTLPAAASGVDGSEIILIERYGQFLWATIADLAALLSTSTFFWNDEPGDRAITSGDMENGISASGASGMQTLTIPSGLTGNAVLIYQAGAGGVQVVAQSGVTLNVRSGLTTELAGQYAVATLIRRAADEWFICGDLATI
jgi:hypothetical protein